MKISSIYSAVAPYSGEMVELILPLILEILNSRHLANLEKNNRNIERTNENSLIIRDKITQCRTIDEMWIGIASYGTSYAMLWDTDIVKKKINGFLAHSIRWIRELPSKDWSNNESARNMIFEIHYNID